MSKYGFLRHQLERRGLLQTGQYVAPAAASAGMISMAHDSNYVTRVFDLGLENDEIRRIGLPLNELVLRRVRLSSAGTLLAGWLALETGLACNAAGGSHHAAAGFGAGFCIFNDVAVAVRNLQAHGLEGRILIVDADVHQGDGTAWIFADDPSVFTLSIHAERNFPARKARSDIDISLPDDTGGLVYLDALRCGLEEAMRITQPVLAFYNAGVDVHADDRLGRLALCTGSLRERDQLVLSTLRGKDVPVACVLGGGYAPRIEDLASHHAILFEEAAQLSH